MNFLFFEILNYEIFDLKADKFINFIMMLGNHNGRKQGTKNHQWERIGHYPDDPHIQITKMVSLTQKLECAGFMGKKSYTKQTKKGL